MPRPARSPFYTNLPILLGGLAWGMLSPGPFDRLRAQEAADSHNSESAHPEAVSGYAFSFPAMGTRVELKAYHADRERVRAAFDRARVCVEQLASILTDYDRQSETRRLTERAYRQRVGVSDSLWQVLIASQHWHSLTDGAFDSSMGSLTRLWRKYRRGGRIPDTELVQQTLTQCGWQHVRLDIEARQIELDRRDIHFDFGGIGKGYVADQAYRVLVESGVDQCLVDISGNIRCGLAPPGQAGWRIAVSDLQNRQSTLWRMELQNAAIATSGDLWQYIEIDGQRHSHILDPDTGYGVVGPIAATVIAANATSADAFATAACILETERGLEIATQEGLQLLIARLDGEQISLKTTPDFPGKPTKSHGDGS